MLAARHARMKHLINTSLLLQLAFGMLAGCASVTGGDRSTLAEHSSREAPESEVAESEPEPDTPPQQARDREDEATQALARARQVEAEAVRQRFDRETVVIGEQAEHFEPEYFDSEYFAEADESDAESGGDDGPRPVLRLYGVPQTPEPTSFSTQAPAIAPGVGPSVAPNVIPSVPRPRQGQLPWRQASNVVPATSQGAPLQQAQAQPPVQPQALPQATYLASLAATPPAPAIAPAQDPTDAYRQALSLFQSRRFDESRAAFESFLQLYPGSDLSRRARYWRAESMYLAEDFGRARVAFEGFVRRHPHDSKAPDALLRAARACAQLGDLDSARRHLSRLSTDYPTSDAARRAGEAR